MTVLTRLARAGVLAATPQPAAGATYAAKVERADAAIDWSGSAEAIDRLIRAFIRARRGHLAFRLRRQGLRADPIAEVSAAAAGTVVSAGKEGIDVACGQGVLRLREVQPASGKRMSAAAFAAGHGVVAGMCFGAPAPD